MNLTIGKKISAAFAVILSLILTLGGTTYYLNTSIHADAEDIHNDDVPGVILYLQILDEIGDMHSNVVEYTTGEIDEVDDFHANHQEFLTYFTQLQPLESSSESDREKMAKIELLVSQYVKEINEQVFNKYKPQDEIWAKQIIDDLEHKQGAELETLLDKLKDEEFAEALNTTDINEAVNDDLPGVRYYLELVDEAGDMLASLSDFVGGESDEEVEFRENADDFTQYFNLLEPLEQKPTEIRDLITINRLYSDIVRTADAVFRRYDPQARSRALGVIDRLEHDILNQLEEILDSSSLEEQTDADNALNALSDTLNTVNSIIITLAIISLIIGVLISYWITNTILRAVGGEPATIEAIANEVAIGNVYMDINTKNDKQTGIYAALQLMINALTVKIKMTEKIAQGDLSTNIELTSQKDSLGIALNKMQLNFKEMVEQANAFANGNYSSQITPRSSQDEFGIALSHMMQQVTDRNQQVEAQNWLKTQVVKISKVSQGIDDLQSMAQQLVSEIAQALEAGHAVFYAKTTEQNSDSYHLLGSYAYVERKNISNSYKIGEGLVGQCALEKHNIVLTNVPDDYIQISSGLGEKKPFNIIVLPVLFEDNCIAIIEVASFKLFTEIQIDFLNQVIASLGITMNSLVSRKRIVNLLQESQSQTEELQSQSEELRATNDELEQKAETLNLQSSELQIANNDLEGKTQALEIKQRDIEIKNQEIEEKAKELAIASKYKSEFLANMSHELRTPLNSLLLLAKGLANNTQGNLSTVQVEDAQVIYDGGNSLLSLINDIMDLSKVEAGKLTIHSESVSFDILKRNLNKMFDPIANDRALSFNVEIADNLPESFISDGLRVEQILRNLLSNAMKFTPQGTVTLTISKPEKTVVFSHSQLTVEDSIAFAVVDSGIGIPKDKQLAIFEAFQQEDGTTSRKYGGTGLGLTIARELSRLLGGEIHLTSKLKAGSTFTLYLSLERKLAQDLAESDEASFTSPHKTNASEQKKTAVQEKKEQNQSLAATPFAEVDGMSDDKRSIREGDRRLLIIEDDPGNQKATRQLLESNNIKITAVATGNEGIAKINTEKYDCIILDLGLPDMSGFELLKTINESELEDIPPIIVYTGREISEQEQKELDAYSASIVIKGVNSAERLLDDVSLFLHQIDKDKSEVINVLHDEEALLKGRKILLVDDDMRNCYALSKMLIEIGLDVELAENGQVALDSLIKEKDFELILMDTMMPVMDGNKATEEIRKMDDYKNIPIIALTAKTMPEDREKCFKAGASEYITKPVDFDSLVSVMRIWLFDSK